MSELKDLRNKMGLSVRVLCSLVHVSIPSVYNVEKKATKRFRSDVIMERINALAKLFTILRKRPDEVFKMIKPYAKELDDNDSGSATG